MAAATLSRLRKIPGSASGSAILLALLEDGFPTEACLGTFEDEEFKERAVVVDRHAPLLVVVVDQWLPGGPLAALQRHGLLRSLIPLCFPSLRVGAFQRGTEPGASSPRPGGLDAASRRSRVR